MRVLRAFFLISIMITGVFAAESVETLTFQGRLTGSDGQPLNGNRHMSYVLYSVDTAGIPIFEWYTDTIQSGVGDTVQIAGMSGGVPIYKGIYAVELEISDSVVQDALKNYDDLYLEVHVKYPSDPPKWEYLIPRVKIASSMFSMMANQVKWAKAEDPTSGNLGIRYNDDSSVGIGREPVGTAKVAIHNRDLATALQIEGNVEILAGSGAAPASDGDLIVGPITLDRSTGYITATRVYDAVWNDLAEFRAIDQGTKKIPGKAYLSTKEGLKLPTKRCQKGVVGIHSDTYGFSLGGKESDDSKIPIAISGWTLAYVDKDYPIGTALVNDKNGILTKASFWEKVKYPERILAVVDHGPIEYNNLDIDGRVWVKVK